MTSAEQIRGCRKLGSSSSTSREGGKRGRIGARSVLRNEAVLRKATHILYGKGDEPEGGRYVGVTVTAVFYDCDSGSGDQNASGTCFFVNDRGLAVTSRHVIEDAVSMQVVLADGSEREAMLVRKQTDIDLALLQVRGDVKTDFLVPAQRPAALSSTLARSARASRSPSRRRRFSRCWARMRPPSRSCRARARRRSTFARRAG